VSAGSQADARAACANANVGGLTGWRLPTMVELLTIVSFTSNDWNDPTAFLNTSYGAGYFVDSNTPDLFLEYDDHYHPWTFRQSSGTSSLRCVRSPYPVADGPSDPPAGRYVMKTGTVVDTLTKLEWQVSTSTTVDLYGAATDYCTNLASSDAGVPAGGNPWRIPSLKELATIWSESAGGLEPTVFGEVFPNGYVWSSTTYWCASFQSVADYNKHVRLDWSPASKKYFKWETEATYNISQTKCVRNAE
jgi:hypothetical protein